MNKSSGQNTLAPKATAAVIPSAPLFDDDVQMINFPVPTAPATARQGRRIPSAALGRPPVQGSAAGRPAAAMAVVRPVAHKIGSTASVGAVSQLFPVRPGGPTAVRPLGPAVVRPGGHAVVQPVGQVAVQPGGHTTGSGGGASQPFVEVPADQLTVHTPSINYTPPAHLAHKFQHFALSNLWFNKVGKAS